MVKSSCFQSPSIHHYMALDQPDDMGLCINLIVLSHSFQSLLQLRLTRFGLCLFWFWLMWTTLGSIQFLWHSSLNCRCCVFFVLFSLLPRRVRQFTLIWWIVMWLRRISFPCIVPALLPLILHLHYSVVLFQQILWRAVTAKNPLLFNIDYGACL